MSDIFSRFKSTVIQSFFYSLGNFAGKFSGVLLLPIYSLYLPVEVFGLYALFEVIFQVFQVFSGLGIKLGLTRWYWDEESTKDKKSLFFTTYLFNLVVCILFSYLLFISFDFLSEYYFKTQINSNFIILFISGNLIKLFSEVPMLLLRVQHKAKQHSVVQIAQLLSFVLFVFIFLAFFHQGIEGIFWANILSGAIQFILVIPVIIRNTKFKFEYKILIEMLVYGFPVALGNMVNITFNFTDKYFLNRFSNLKVVGTFTLAHKLSNIVNLLIVNSFMNAYMHNYFKGIHDENNDRFYSRSFTYFLLAITFFSLLLIVFIDEAIFVFSANNKDYSQSAVIVPVLTIGLIFGGIRQILTLPINKIKKTRIIGVLSILSGVLNVYLNYILIPEYNALGAAYATGVVQVFSSVVLLVFVLRNVNIPFEWRRIKLILLSFTLTITLFYLVSFNIWFLNFVFKIAVTIVWGVFLYYSNFLLPEEKQRIFQFAEKWWNIRKLKNNLQSLKENKKND
ncbi:lipopolysaccharide biosynthesis protein [Plebeiibacterium sediminum]|uniref:Oligosaccharide flippase family protein n=1 Tax=Plebeiibacterium sediminum TaxID=2992112 RepID=A0AAE3M4U3_9BACT|nr:oligosaccharide flippase family protein [Plebeiobacterium sediminum]MCW3787144.1 oligosaccharide flippase family protein [Plebeiobacterium sediminum]